ncbi:MAG TPA: protein-disulfide reductase DsbD N-terminal domain-containing protein [Bryobacteraceae bacterium]|nr:protein-disulfide reductase DsbD N-terminal domain-containing protein [Bryobacteraceae bacterium]
MRAPGSVVLLAFTLAAASPDPVAWKIEGAPAKAAKGGDRFTIKLVAEIEEGWHLYSMKEVADGPVATRIWLAEGQPVQLAGPIRGDPPEMVEDASFNMEVEEYLGQAEFTLPLRATGWVSKLAVNVSYQSCNNRICLPPKTVKVEAALGK